MADSYGKRSAIVAGHEINAFHRPSHARCSRTRQRVAALLKIAASTDSNAAAGMPTAA